MPVYEVEIDGKRYDIEGDRPPTEQEARAAVGVYAGGGGVSAESTGDVPIDVAQPAAQSPPKRPGAVSRFLEPFAEAAKGAGGLVKRTVKSYANPTGTTFHPETGDFDVDLSESLPARSAREIAGIVKGMTGRQLEQFAKAREALRGGDFKSGVRAGGHVLAGAVPVLGPVAADIGEDLGAGNVAGALGEATLAALPFTKTGRLGEIPARVLRNRAAARALSTLDPTGEALARDVANVSRGVRGEALDRLPPDVAELVSHSSVFEGTPLLSGVEIPGLRPGTHRSIARQAEARLHSPEMEASHEGLKGMSAHTESAGRTAAQLESRAARRETTPPPHIEMRPSEHGLVDQYGDPVMEAFEVQPPASSMNPEMVAALRREAEKLRTLEGNYTEAGEGVPAGEMFKQRSAAGEKASQKNYFGLKSETEGAAGSEAVGQARDIMSAELHKEFPRTIVADRAYRVWKTATRSAKQAMDRSLSPRGMKNLYGLLEGRLLGNIVRGAAMGGAAGLASGGGVAAGTFGALFGTVLSNSTFWHSLRGVTYTKLARALEAGAEREAGSILEDAALEFAAQEAKRKGQAQSALQEQGNSVVSER